MADVKKASSRVQDMAQQPTKDSPVSGVQSKIQSGTNTLLGSIEGWGSVIAGKGKALVDGIFPPEKRAAFLAKLQAFMLANPKLSAFLGLNFALTGFPLGLFILFSITVFIFALVVAIIVALLAAILFTLGMVGIALLVVLPTVMFTTGAACFLFLWGLGGYYILRWANGDKENGGEPKQAPEGGAIGDTLDRWSGGKLGGLMEGARKNNAKKGIEGYNDRYTQPEETQANGTAGGEKTTPSVPSTKSLHPESAANEAQKQVAGVTSQATNATGGAAQPASNALGTVKGGVGGATGLGG